MGACSEHLTDPGVFGGSATAAVQAVSAAARSKAAPAHFEAVVARSAATLRSVFGLPVSAPRRPGPSDTGTVN